MRLMKVCLEYAHWHGGKLYMSGDVLNLDEASALWLIAKGLAEEVEDEPEPEPDDSAHIAGDAPQPQAARRPRGKTLPTPSIPASEEGETDSPLQEIDQ